MDCLHRIPLSGTPAHHHRPKSHSSCHTRSTSCQCHKDRCRCISLGHNPILTDITAKVTMTPAEAVPGHTMGITGAIIGAVPNTHTQTLIHIILAATLHIADHLSTEALQLTSKIAADHTFNQPTNPPREPCTNLCHIPENHKAKHIPKGIQELQ